MRIVLASSSPYRRALLQKAGLDFTCVRPPADEEDLKRKWSARTPEELAGGLSRAKAESVFRENPDALVIAGDQLVAIGHEILGKPGGYGAALDQLRRMNGGSHRLLTAITLMRGDSILEFLHVTTLTMKKLTENELSRYLRLDLPYDCAGSYKIEEHGISLFEKIESDDWSAIQGIPMIWLTARLKEMGYELFKK